jgi:FtsH-binding integral membrane protein
MAVSWVSIRNATTTDPQEGTMSMFGGNSPQQPYGQHPYAAEDQAGFAAPTRAIPVAQADTDTRATFIGRVYMHLLVAVLTFTAIEVALFMSGIADDISDALLGVPWLLVLGAFVLGGTLASKAAYKAESVQSQYLGLFGYVLFEAIIFVPLLVFANDNAPGAIESAAFVTVLTFCGLTAIVWFTRADFSFLRPLLLLGSLLAFVAIIGGAIFGFQLGLWFMVAMVGLACGYILWTTSRILNQFPEDRYVGAALELFASVALLFYYVLMIFAGGRR